MGIGEGRGDVQEGLEDPEAVGTVDEGLWDRDHGLWRQGKRTRRSLRRT